MRLMERYATRDLKKRRRRIEGEVGWRDREGNGGGGSGKLAWRGWEEKVRIPGECVDRTKSVGV